MKLQNASLFAAIIIGAASLAFIEYGDKSSSEEDKPNCMAESEGLASRHEVSPLGQPLRTFKFGLALAESPVEPSLRSPSRIDEDVKALVGLGSREAGTSASEKALAYLSKEYQEAGYQTEVQTFTYSKFEDRGSSLSVEGNTVTGRALKGSIAGSPTAPLIVVPNVGTKEDFARVDLEGKIALVRRGKIRFEDKANNAVAAGAVGLIVVNNAPGNFLGTLITQVKLPVLSLSQEQGKSLLRSSQELPEVMLNVDTVRRPVTGRNLIARMADSTQPKVIVGGHYDSVSGSPGANDNASGTAVVLNLARQLAETEQARQVWFVAFDGEEDGLHGSRSFVDNATSQFLSELEGMINFDMVGVNHELKISGTPSLTDIIRKDDSVAQIGAVGGSDHIPFDEAKVPAIFFTRGLDPAYHTPDDISVDPKLLEETVEVGWKAIAQLIERN